MTNDNILSTTSDGIDTYRYDGRSGRRSGVTADATLLGDRRYVAPMTTSANSVITAINHRKPGLKPAKQRLLLFFVQGQYLAWKGEPMFGESLIAIDRGVTVEAAVGDDSELPNSMLITITQCVSRYAQLSAAELRLLIQASEPWLNARKLGAGPAINLAELRAWFRRDDETDDPDDERLNRAEMAEAMAFFRTLKD